jgi:outer membrane protein assembly factor BamB
VIIAFCWVGLLAAQSKSEPPDALFPIRTVWTLALNNQLKAPPAFDGTHVFFSIASDRIVAYELKTGTQKWIVSGQPQFGPLTGDGLVIFADADGLTALHGDDGSPAWSLPLADKPAQHPVWDNGWLVVATMDGTVHAFRASDGYRVWSREVGSPAHAPPALAADRVYVATTDGRIVALRVEDGAPEWERRLGGRPNEILALDDRLYVGAADNYFYCLMANDGRVDWRWRTGGDTIGRAIADEHRVYFVALDNILRALNQISGNQHWMRPLPFRPIAAPVKAGGTLVVAGQTPTLRGYNIGDGSAAGEIQAPPEAAAPPHVAVDDETGLPLLLYLTRELDKGATATLITRSLEPNTTPIAPLPNVMTVGPGTPLEK